MVWVLKWEKTRLEKMKEEENWNGSRVLGFCIKGRICDFAKCDFNSCFTKLHFLHISCRTKNTTSRIHDMKSRILLCSCNIENVISWIHDFKSRFLRLFYRNENVINVIYDLKSRIHAIRIFFYEICRNIKF